MRKSSRIPNLRNLGINLRILIISNAAVALVALILSSGLTDFIGLLTTLCTIAQPILLLSLLLLYGSYTHTEQNALLAWYYQYLYTGFCWCVAACLIFFRSSFYLAIYQTVCAS